MFHWLFGKTIKKHLKKELSSINKVLDNSFSNIKQDFLNMHGRVSFHDKNYENILRRLERLEDHLLKITSPISQKYEREVDEGEFSPKILESEWSSLTERQKDILKVLARLQFEGGKEWISLKQLVDDMYHDKNYDDIRPLVSSYISILVEHNLAKKKRVGKQLFVSLSEKSQSYISKFPESKKKKMLRLQKEVD
ncbi:MAG: hypothetical protein KKG75_01900 [Nanoarchaeota archaeon]|nr:hypothetical protein [Nanoarchaeota archaeon]